MSVLLSKCQVGAPKLGVRFGLYVMIVTPCGVSITSSQWREEVVVVKPTSHDRAAKTRSLLLILLAIVLGGIAAAPPASAALAPDASVSQLTPARANCSRPPYSRLVNGINIDKTCQRAYFVRNGKIVRKTRVSTGKRGYATRSGYFRIYRRLNRWAESKLYPGAYMYRPMFFSGGQAIHGSVTDALVKPYPASHGCVRMPKADVRWLWSHGWGVGTRVYVFYR